MSNVSAWSATAASNNAAVPNGAPEGMAPSGVNDVIRENMAAGARWYASLDGSLESTGSSNAYVITTGSSHAALADIGLLVFRANHTNTTAATLAVDGLAAKALNFNGAALIAGQITSGQVYVVAYNSTGDVYNLANITGIVTLDGAQTLTNKTLTAPTMTTPVLGTPASGALTNCTADGTNAVGFRTIPQNSQSAAYELVLADSGKHILHPSADTTARTFTIPANGSVAFPIGTAVTFVNQVSGGVVTIAITTDTMRLAGAGTTGSRTLAANGVATAIKLTSTEWIISGTGLT
jgi:hypothetical protein